MKAKRRKAGRAHVEQLLGKQGLDGGVHSRFASPIGTTPDLVERRLRDKHLRAYLRGDEWFTYRGQFYRVAREAF